MDQDSSSWKGEVIQLCWRKQDASRRRASRRSAYENPEARARPNRKANHTQIIYAFFRPYILTVRYDLSP